MNKPALILLIICFSIQAFATGNLDSKSEIEAEIPVITYLKVAFLPIIDTLPIYVDRNSPMRKSPVRINGMM